MDSSSFQNSFLSNAGLTPWSVPMSSGKQAGQRSCENTGRASKIQGNRAVPQVGSLGLRYRHIPAQGHIGQGCNGPWGSGNPNCGGTLVQPRSQGAVLVPTASYTPSVSSEGQANRCQVSQSQRRSLRAVPIVHEQGRAED